METTYVWVIAILAFVIVAKMFFDKVREINVADVDAGAAVGSVVSFWIKGKNTKSKDKLPTSELPE